VRVGVLDNLNKDEDFYMTMEVSFTNTGQRDIEDGDWKIYFYT